MKLTINRSQFLKGLGRLQAIVEKRNTMPILANVLLAAQKSTEGATLEFAATDLEIGVRGHQTAEVEEEGSITVSARKLYDITKELTAESVELQAKDEAILELRSGRALFSLAGAPASEYPEMPSVKAEKLVRIPALVLADMIDRTIYAASTDESRYNLNGVCFEVEKKEQKIRMVATDGHRLSLATRAAGEGIEELTNGVIIPRKGLAELRRLAEEEDADEIEIGFEGNSALVRKGGVTLAMRLIEGEFPSYQQVLPQNFEVQVNVGTEALLKALKRVALVSAERSRAIKFLLSPGTLTISATNPDLGEAQEEIDVDYDGESIEIGFNARYLIDALGAIGTEETQLNLSGANAPVQLTPATDKSSLAVVMPMRL